MLVEEGFDVLSVDASDRMLKYALRQRWRRRKEPAFDRWSQYRSSLALHAAEWRSGAVRIIITMSMSMQALGNQFSSRTGVNVTNQVLSRNAITSEVKSARGYPTRQTQP